MSERFHTSDATVDDLCEAPGAAGDKLVHEQHHHARCRACDESGEDGSTYDDPVTRLADVHLAAAIERHESHDEDKTTQWDKRHRVPVDGAGHFGKIGDGSLGEAVDAGSQNACTCRENVLKPNEKKLKMEEHTNKSTDSPGHVYYSAASKVPESLVPQPASFCPAPVRWDGVDYSCHERAEDDVTVEVTSLGDGAGHDGGAGSGKSALNDNSN
jgi:hypothetical protein